MQLWSGVYPPALAEYRLRVLEWVEKILPQTCLAKVVGLRGSPATPDNREGGIGIF